MLRAGLRNYPRDSPQTAYRSGGHRPHLAMPLRTAIWRSALRDSQRPWPHRQGRGSSREPRGVWHANHAAV